MNNEEVIGKARAVFEELLPARGFELIDVTYRYENGRNVLRALVDRPAGGITMDECAGLNRQIGDILEERAVISEIYNLEVSSPGLDRPLRTERDFARNRGKQIKVFLSEPINGKIEVDGTVGEVSSRELALLTSDGPLGVPLEKINKAKLII